MPIEPETVSDLLQLKGGEDDSWRSGLDRDAIWSMKRRSRIWRPPTDVFEQENAFVVVVEIAGMRGADFSVTYEDQILTIRGQRAEGGSNKGYHQMEIPYGDFETHVRMPEAIDASQADAAYEDGFLRVRLPRLRPRRLEIEE